MPRNVRNFWVELEVDGKKTKIATGPVAKDGGFHLRVLIREGGSIANGSLQLSGLVKDGELSVTGFGGELLHFTTLLRGKR